MAVLMTGHSLSLDDHSEKELFVFSGTDLLTSHYDIADLDWQEVTERSLLDERRGLVIAQVAVLEDLVDELIKYLDDAPDQRGLQSVLDRQTIGPRVDHLETLLAEARALDAPTQKVVDDLRLVVRRRNELAHGTLDWRPIGNHRLGDRDVTLEWIIENRRDRSKRRITMSEFRSHFYDAIAVFGTLLSFADVLVQKVSWPRHFTGRHYLVAPIR